MQYSVKGQTIHLTTPEDFDFNQCLTYMGRSDIECLHRVIDKALYKVLDYNDFLYMIKVCEANRDQNDNTLFIELLNDTLTEALAEYLSKYIWDMLDLGIDLTGFYEAAKSDKILNELVNRYKGLRIVKILDLYESLCWAIIGQQINLKFAYTLKQRVCATYGKAYEYEERLYYTFPEPDKLATLEVEDLRALQFTGRKSEYLIGISKLFVEGAISKEKLLALDDFESIQKLLMDIRGIGHWTADYAILKCLNHNEAFPIADIGIHNGLKVLLGRDKKPSKEEIFEMAKAWSGWEAYATFFIWRSLYT